MPTREARSSTPTAEPPADEPPPPAGADDRDESGGDVQGGPSADAGDDAPDVDRADGTHEYECTKCGYILFPAAGREFKFFGAGFTCPGCGAGKDAFVDNGPVE